MRQQLRYDSTPYDEADLIVDEDAPCPPHSLFYDEHENEKKQIRQKLPNVAAVTESDTSVPSSSAFFWDEKRAGDTGGRNTSSK